MSNAMIGLWTLATAEARHPVLQEDVEVAARERFRGAAFDVDALARVFGRSGIERRTFALPLDAYQAGLSFEARQEAFLRTGEDLLTTAAERAVPMDLRERVTHVVTINSTGVATPSLECGVIERVGLSAGARRLPVFGLGCAGGAAGLQIARDLAASSAHAVVLVLCVELTSLTFLASDLSQQNFVACALFGDGAAAALVAGEGAISSVSGERRPLAQLGSSASRLLPDTRDYMGWDVRPDGWRVVFSTRIPAVVKREARALVEQVASREGLRHWVLHPGGRKVLEAYRASLQLGDRELAPATRVLARHGNMSSVTVFYVLEEILRQPDFEPGPAVATAFGPGFSAEALALDLRRAL